MKAHKINHRHFLGLFVTLFLFALIPQTALCQTEKLGIVTYTPPKDWIKTTKNNVVAFAEVNQTTGGFCIITLYGATPSSDTPEANFKKQWNYLVVDTFKAEPDPKTETVLEDGWTAVAGGTAVDFQGSKSVAFLSVISGGGKTISVLAVFNDASYGKQLAAFTSKIELGKAVAEVPAPPREEVPVATASPILEMHAAALVREFENNEIRANQTFVGKRVRIHGIINTIEIDRDGRVVLTFKSSVTTRNNAQCFFTKSGSSRVASLTAHEEGTVEGVVKGLGGGFGGAKAFLVLTDCIVP